MTRPQTTIEICISDRSAPFVCGVWGWITTSALEEIEAQLDEDMIPEDLPSDTETIRVKATWTPDEYQDFGGVPMVINKGYWDFEVLKDVAIN